MSASSIAKKKKRCPKVLMGIHIYFSSLFSMEILQENANSFRGKALGSYFAVSSTRATVENVSTAAQLAGSPWVNASVGAGREGRYIAASG
jgi:hypothetical protein